MNAKDSKQLLVEYIENNFDVDADEIENDTPLFSSNIIDSFGMIDLVAFIEKEFAIKFSALEMHLDNLDSIEKMSAFISRKK